MMRKNTQRRPLRKPRKLRIVFNLRHDPDLMEPLFEESKKRNWQLFDLMINSYILPLHPPPDGAIISKAWGSPLSYHVGRKFECPTVRLGHFPGEENCPYPQVLLDRYAAGKMAVDHLAERGYEHIAVIIQHDWQHVDNVFKGVKDAVKSKQLPFHIVKLEGPQDGDLSQKHTRWNQCILDNIQQLPRPLALVAANDCFAAKFSFLCESLGLSIPEDIAIISVSNRRYICDGAPASISSVDVDHELQIQKATDTLAAMLNGEPAPQGPIIIPPRGVVTRQSTDLLAVSDPRVAKAVRFLWNHLDWPITADDVAYEVGMSRRSLDRAFTKCLQRGVNAEFRRKRLERCGELLKNSDMTLAQIRKEIGIKSQAYLNRTFLKIYGMTPSEFRSKS